MSIVTKLLAACKGEEAKYIVRSLEGKLRIGNAERTVLVALAHAVVLAEQDKCMQHVLEDHHELIYSCVAGKKWSTEKLASRLEEGSSIVKSVYRYGRYALIVVPLPIPPRCQ